MVRLIATNAIRLSSSMSPFLVGMIPSTSPMTKTTGNSRPLLYELSSTTLLPYHGSSPLGRNQCTEGTIQCLNTWPQQVEADLSWQPLRHLGWECLHLKRSGRNRGLISKCQWSQTESYFHENQSEGREARLALYILPYIRQIDSHGFQSLVKVKALLARELFKLLEELSADVSVWNIDDTSQSLVSFCGIRVVDQSKVFQEDFNLRPAVKVEPILNMIWNLVLREYLLNYP